jgi:choline dehydrogenase
MLVDSPGQFASKSYDYVIIGGGTAGLTLAARLTEDPNVSVGVIEAGQNRLADPNILVPGCKSISLIIQSPFNDCSGFQRNRAHRL